MVGFQRLLNTKMIKYIYFLLILMFSSLPVIAAEQLPGFIVHFNHILIGKDIPRLKDTISLFNEPPGPEDELRYNQETIRLYGKPFRELTLDDKDKFRKLRFKNGSHLDDMDKETPALYLGCIQNRYKMRNAKQKTPRLISKRRIKSRVAEPSDFVTLHIYQVMIAGQKWRFQYDDDRGKMDEEYPPNTIAPDGMKLSDVQDKCLFPKK